ncbi:MAG TPA: ABC-2 family transporter protein [Polyangiaceae bacterium]|nr:ABC-2 family transporter protein [Polyangiaceae bacterium]
MMRRRHRGLSFLGLYLRYARLSLGTQLEYPVSALLLAAGQFLVTALEAIVLWVLFDRFGGLRGWRFGEVALFYALVHIQFALADVLSRGFDVLGTQFIRTGQLDRLLLRPRSLTLQLMGHDVRLSRIGRLAQATIVLAIATEHAPIAWTLAKALTFAFAVAGGVGLFVGLFVLQGALSFWTIQGLEIANVLTYGGMEAAQYPLAVYARWFRRLLIYAVPLGAVAYFPALAILEKADPLGTPSWLHAYTPAAGFAFLALTFLAWRQGIRRYTSTGS